MGEVLNANTYAKRGTLYPTNGIIKMTRSGSIFFISLLVYKRHDYNDTSNTTAPYLPCT
jgi:hypothetical protein